MLTYNDAMQYHSCGVAGKIATVVTKPLRTVADMAMAYSPGVAEVALAIRGNTQLTGRYTNRDNTVALVSNGTATLGLGDTGPEAVLPVLEGKAAILKRFANLDGVPILLDSREPAEMIKSVIMIHKGFGGINLEDIRAPECFAIARELMSSLKIPVIHDDQHGTAVVISAALINACRITNRLMEDIIVVVNGAGAAGIAFCRMSIQLGVRCENLFVLDSMGLVTQSRNDINEWKRQFATARHTSGTLSDVIDGADVFVGLSVGGILSKADVIKMKSRPIIFALANPTPEITPSDAKEARSDCIVATGRSDYKNQINNALAFPYMFRAALDTKATAINNAMMLAAAHKIAELATEETPKEVRKLYKHELVIGDDYIVPSIFDTRLLVDVSSAVARAALESGVATTKSWCNKEYTQSLEIHKRDVMEAS